MTKAAWILCLGVAIASAAYAAPRLAVLYIQVRLISDAHRKEAQQGPTGWDFLDTEKSNSGPYV